MIFPRQIPSASLFWIFILDFLLCPGPFFQFVLTLSLFDSYSALCLLKCEAQTLIPERVHLEPKEGGGTKTFDISIICHSIFTYFRLSQLKKLPRCINPNASKFSECSLELQSLNSSSVNDWRYDFMHITKFCKPLSSFANQGNNINLQGFFKI